MNKFRLIGVWLGIATLYFFLAKFGLQFAFLNKSITTIWFPTGLATACFFLFGNAVISAIFVGAFLTNITITGLSFLSFCIAIGNTLEAVIIIYIIKKFINNFEIFGSIRNITIVVIAFILGSIVSASLGVEALALLGNINQVREGWVTWFLGDLSGGLLLAPLIILWVTKPHLFWQKKNFFYILILILVILIIGEIIFSGIFPFSYIIIPVLIWITFEFSQTTAAATIFLLATLAIYNTLQKHGPFITHDVNDSLIALQLFIVTMVPTVLIASTIALKKKHTHNSLVSKQTYLKTIIEKSPDAILLLNAKGKIIFTNRSVKNLLGNAKSHIIGRNIMSFIHLRDKPIFVKSLTEISKISEKEMNIQFRMFGKSGEIVWLEGMMTNLLDNEYIDAILMNIRDVTKKKEAEELKSKLAAIVETSHDAIFTKALNRSITSWNKGAEKMYGYSAKEIVGKSINSILPEGYYHRILKPLIDKVKKGKKVENFESFQVRKNGITFPVAISLIPIKDMQNNTTEVCVTVRNISYQKELEKKKQEIISIAGHELKTPITSLSLNLQSLQRNAAMGRNSLSKTYLSKMDKQLKRVHFLIRDLLDLSRIRIGKLSFEYTQFNLVALTKEVASDFDYVQDGATIRIYGLKKLEIIGDKNRIAQVITNLITNAVKYSKKAIAISITKTKNEALFTIKDHGIGIAKSQQKKIFDNFYRADNAQQFSGSGIGLYLASQIIKEHNGELWVTSEKGKGSTFYFSIPQEQ